MDMSVVPAAVVSTASLISNAISSVKNARELVKDTSDSALKSSVADAYDALLDLRERLLTQDEEIRTLMQRLAQREEYVGPLPAFGYVFAKTDEAKQNPLCPKCFQNEPRKLAFLSDSQPFSGGMRRDCNMCDFVSWEVPIGTNSSSNPSIHVTRRGWRG